METEFLISTSVRGANAFLWTVVVILIWRKDMPVSRLARRLFLSVLFLGMWVLFFNSLVAFGLIPVGVARTVTTVFTGYAAVIAMGILTSREGNP